MKSATALVLGATGGIGSEVAARLLSDGWLVRALHRNPDRQPAGPIHWIRGMPWSRPMWRLPPAKPR